MPTLSSSPTGGSSPEITGRAVELLGSLIHLSADEVVDSRIEGSEIILNLNFNPPTSARRSAEQLAYSFRLTGAGRIVSTDHCGETTPNLTIAVPLNLLSTEVPLPDLAAQVRDSVKGVGAFSEPEAAQC